MELTKSEEQSGFLKTYAKLEEALIAANEAVASLKEMKGKLEKAVAAQTAGIAAITERIEGIERGLVHTQEGLASSLNIYNSALTILDARVAKLEMDSGGVLPN